MNVDGIKMKPKKWKTIPYEFKTVLGTSHVFVDVWDTEEEGIFFKPGEEQRLEKAQAEKILILILDKYTKLEPTEFTELQIAHIKRVLGIKKNPTD